MPALPDNLWMEFLNFHYCCNLPLSTTNTCFLNTFVYNSDFNPKMIKELLCEIFYRENKLRYILIAECPDYSRYQGMPEPNYYCLEEFSVVFYPKCFSVNSCPNTQKLHVIMRDDMLPRMRYRKALPEDNDDIIDIADKDRPDLKEELGEYYIAEELLANTKSLLIVAEINNVTAGFVWLSDNVNLLALLENYYLQSYGNLLKFNTRERFKEKILFVSTAQKRPLEKLFTTEIINQIYKYVGEISNIENVSNLSLCSHKVESNEGDIVVINEKRFQRQLVLKKWEEFNEKIKSSDYYVQLRRRQFGFYYNIPNGQHYAPFDANSNVFVIHLFGLKSPHDHRRIFRFLSSGFAAFPDKDYCLFSINVANHITPTLFEILKYFISVARRPDCLIDEHLFITHRSAVYGDISLFPVTPDDVKPIKKLILEESSEGRFSSQQKARSGISTTDDRFSFKSHLSERSGSYMEISANQHDLDHVTDILKHIFEDPFSEYAGYTIRCGDSSRPKQDNTIVGFVIVRPFHLNYYLRKHFHIYGEDEFQNFLKAEVIILKIHPFFHFQSDLIFRELSRQTCYRCFYYFRPTDHYYLSNDLVASMQPLEPRRVKRIWFNYLKSAPKSSRSDDRLHLNIDILHDKVAVFIHNLRPCVNFGNQMNIVILGFNDICKAFLRLMIFTWHHFSDHKLATINCSPQLNITVICGPGIMEADYENAFKCKTCSKENSKNCWIDFYNSDDFITDVCERMDLRAWIKFVNGKIAAIDTEEQLITMKTGCEIYYETLLLMCGTEFGENIFQNRTPPPNYCHINNRFDKIIFYHKLDILLNDLHGNATKSLIVYGSHVKTFEFINFLLKHGVKAEEIHLVVPYSVEERKMDLRLNNSAKDDRIMGILREMIEDLGVQIYDQMNLSDYTLYDDNGNLREIKFKKFLSNEQVTMECDLFISFEEVLIAGPLIKIFQKSGINTQDNFVLVNDKYQTSAPNIYAMGNFIKHEVEPNHQYRFVSSQEAAEKIIQSLDLMGDQKNIFNVDEKFSRPSYFQAQLPMDFFLVKVTIPKRYLANHLDNEYSFPMVTYYDEDFSRVKLNEHGVVEEIVIVTKKKLNFDFLKFFCGCHELLLNNMKSRWYLKDIRNFLDFFQEHWTEVLMHKNFNDLRIINKIIITDVAKEIMKKNLDRNGRLKLFYNFGKTIGLNRQLEYTFLEFLREHREDFYTEVALPEDFPNIKI
ncbi:cilia- and flagella-associated protein 61-like [Cochliomyia hominivorax]